LSLLLEKNQHVYVRLLKPTNMCLSWVCGRILGGVGGKFYSHTRFEVGDGSKVRFWHDLWCGDMALKDVFPVLFGIAHTKDALVEAHMKFSGGAIQ
jgi:hypothetical protein